MSKKSKSKLPFDGRGGVLAVSRAMRESKTYETMKPASKVLMDLLQMQWRNERLIGYGVREASKKIGCTLNTASKAFNELQERGFIICIDQSSFNSRNGSKAREWQLTWMPYENKPPTNNWEKFQK